METIHKFEVTIATHGKNCDLKIDGQSLPHLRAFSVVSDCRELSKVHVEMLAIDPFTINGEGQIVVKTTVVNELVARQVYESLKKIFEK